MSPQEGVGGFARPTSTHWLSGWHRIREAPFNLDMLAHVVEQECDKATVRSAADQTSPLALHVWADCAGYSGIGSEAIVGVRSQIPRKRKASARQRAATGHSSDDNYFDGKKCCLFSAVPMRVDFIINATA
jgi:hypothetical protein